MSTQKASVCVHYLLKYSAIQCQGMYYTYFFFSRPLSAFLQHYYSSAQLMLLSKIQQQAWKMSNSGEETQLFPQLHKKHVLSFMEKWHNSATNANGCFIRGQSSGMLYLFFSAHLSPSPLKRFPFFLANALNKMGPLLLSLHPLPRWYRAWNVTEISRESRSCSVCRAV